MYYNNKITPNYSCYGYPPPASCDVRSVLLRTPPQAVWTKKVIRILEFTIRMNNVAAHSLQRSLHLSTCTAWTTLSVGPRNKRTLGICFDFFKILRKVQVWVYNHKSTFYIFGACPLYLWAKAPLKLQADCEMQPA